MWSLICFSWFWCLTSMPVKRGGGGGGFVVCTLRHWHSFLKEGGGGGVMVWCTCLRTDERGERENLYGLHVRGGGGGVRGRERYIADYSTDREREGRTYTHKSLHLHLWCARTFIWCTCWRILCDVHALGFCTMCMSKVTLCACPNIGIIIDMKCTMGSVYLCTPCDCTVHPAKQSHRVHTPWLRDHLAGLLVKASASGAEDLGFESRLRRDFSGSSHTNDFKIGTPVSTLPGAWHSRVSAGTGQPSTSILWLGKVEVWSATSISVW